MKCNRHLESEDNLVSENLYVYTKIELLNVNLCLRKFERSFYRVRFCNAQDNFLIDNSQVKTTIIETLKNYTFFQHKK